MHRIVLILLLTLLLALSAWSQTSAEPPADLETVAIKIMVKAFQVGDYETVETLFDNLSLENKVIFLRDAVEMTVTTDKEDKGTLVETTFMQAVGAAPDDISVALATYLTAKARQTQLLGRLTASLLTQQPKSTVPAVVKMNPPNGSKDVDPNITEITVTFDRPMMCGMAWCSMDGSETYPGQAEKKMPVWSEDKQTCTMQKVVLKPGRTYNIWLNSEEELYSNIPGDGFRCMDNVPLKPVHYTFTTKTAE
jgi:hypothetical protein